MSVSGIFGASFTQNVSRHHRSTRDVNSPGNARTTTTVGMSNCDRSIERHTVFIVDDEVSIREALGSLFRSVGLNVQTFGSSADFLSSNLPNVPGCLIADIRLQGLSGLELQAKLTENNVHLPVIIMTGHGDIPMSVQAFKAGAVDFLTKPFRDQDMLDAATRAIAQDERRREQNKAVAGVLSRYESLTPRQRQIMELVTSGLMNKQIAAEVALQEITVKIHRGQVMRKMGARSLPDLVRMDETLKKMPVST